MMQIPEPPAPELAEFPFPPPPDPVLAFAFNRLLPPPPDAPGP